MMEKIGFDIVLDELDDQELTFCQQALAHYDSIKNVIWHGDQYRLLDPYHNPAASILYVDDDKDEGVMFNYLVENRYGSKTSSPIQLKGLDPEKNYAIEEINVYPASKPAFATTTYSGDYLMKIGINPNLRDSQESVVLKISTAN